MRVIVGCEFSQIVTNAFRKKGHDAFSCDLLPTEGNPNFHFQEDILELLKREKFDLGIFHPPCTYLAVTGNKWFKDEYKNRFPTRKLDRENAIEFFMKIYNMNIPRIAIENPVGIMSTIFRKPDQIIQPYMFGDQMSKKTCLWLKGLPLLTATNIVDKGEFITYKSGKRCAKWYSDAAKYDPATRTKIRNKTFKGIAEAMADQWNF